MIKSKLRKHVFFCKSLPATINTKDFEMVAIIAYNSCLLINKLFLVEKGYCFKIYSNGIEEVINITNYTYPIHGEKFAVFIGIKKSQMKIVI